MSCLVVIALIWCLLNENLFIELALTECQNFGNALLLPLVCAEKLYRYIMAHTLLQFDLQGSRA